MTGGVAVSTYVSPHTIIASPFFGLAAGRAIVSVADLSRHCFRVYAGGGGFRRLLAGRAHRSVLGESFLGRITEMLRMELGVGLKPLFRRAVLMFLKIRDEIIEDIGEVVFETVVADKAFRPYEEAGAPLGDESDADRGIDKPCGEKGVQLIERILQFRPGVEELRFAAVQWLDDTLNVFLNVPVPKGLVPVQFREFVNVERAIRDAFHGSLGHPMPTRENVLRELQGLREGGLGHTWLVNSYTQTLCP